MGSMNTGSQHPSNIGPGGLHPHNQGLETRKIIWTGEIHWKDTSKMEHTIVCSVTSKKDDNGMPEVRPDNWPRNLVMQLYPKTLVQKVGGHFFNHCRSVLFHPQKSESLDILTKVLGSGHAGCVVRNSTLYRLMMTSNN